GRFLRLANRREARRRPLRREGHRQARLRGPDVLAAGIDGSGDRGRQGGAMSPLEIVERKTMDALTEIASNFKPGHSLGFVLCYPDKPDRAFVVVTEGTRIEDLVDCLRRRAAAGLVPAEPRS